MARSTGGDFEHIADIGASQITPWDFPGGSSEAHPCALSFPTLTPDGSTEDLRLERYLISDDPTYPTPPAALSSLSFRRRMDLSDSQSSISDAYDMVDDVSDNETVSITSTIDRSEAESLVGEYGEGGLDEPTIEENFGGSRVLRAPVQNYDDELDDQTPRQSIMPQPVLVQPKQPAPGTRSYLSELSEVAMRLPWSAIFSALISFLFALALGIALHRPDGFAEVETRRQLLSQSFANATRNTVDIEHLLPYPALVHVDFLGRKSYNWTNSFHHQAVAPNHMIFAVPRRESMLGNYPMIKSLHVHQGDETLDFNQTMLLDGVYDITIDSADAHGMVTVSAFAVRPMTDTMMRFDFGGKPKGMSERGRTAHQTALSLRDTITRDLQIFVNTTAVFLDGARTVAYDRTKKTIEARVRVARKNVKFIQKKYLGGVERVEQEAAKRVQIACKNAKSLRKKYLSGMEQQAMRRVHVARDNANFIKKKVLGGKSQRGIFQGKKCKKCKP